MEGDNVSSGQLSILVDVVILLLRQVIIAKIRRTSNIALMLT